MLAIDNVRCYRVQTQRTLGQWYRFSQDPTRAKNPPEKHFWYTIKPNYRHSCVSCSFQ